MIFVNLGQLSFFNSIYLLLTLYSIFHFLFAHLFLFSFLSFPFPLDSCPFVPCDGSKDLVAVADTQFFTFPSGFEGVDSCVDAGLAFDGLSYRFNSPRPLSGWVLQSHQLLIGSVKKTTEGPTRLHAIHSTRRRNRVLSVVLWTVAL